MGNIDYNRIFRKVRISVVKMPWKKILAFSFCLILSAIFWFIQVYRQSFNSTYDIPVKYVNIPDSLIFETNLPDKINVTIRDNGSALFKNFFTHNNDSIEIDVRNIVKHSSSKILQGVSFEQLVRSKLLPTSELLNYSPGQISFYYTPLSEKKAPVIFDGQIFLATGYLLNGDIQVQPDSIMVYGAKDVLSSLSYAYTVNDTLDNFKSQQTLIYKIKEVHNVKFVPEQVNVIVPVDKYTQKDVSVRITCINLPLDLNVRFFPSTAKVSFLIGVSKYESITSDDFEVQFDYSDLRGMKTSFVPLRITSSPDHAQNLFISPTEVEFIFEKK